MTRDGSELATRESIGVLDLRPVVWDAAMVTPSEVDGVTIVLRVTYRTLEAIILDVSAVTATGTRRPN